MWHVVTDTWVGVVAGTTRESKEDVWAGRRC